MSDKVDVSKTVEYRPDNRRLIITVRQKGKETVTIVANTVPESAASRIRESEKKST
jgi:hypothetical protein